MAKLPKIPLTKISTFAPNLNKTSQRSRPTLSILYTRKSVRYKNYSLLWPQKISISKFRGLRIGQ